MIKDPRTIGALLLGALAGTVIGRFWTAGEVPIPKLLLSGACAFAITYMGLSLALQIWQDRKAARTRKEP